jgi:hypothetical protein
MDRAQRAAGPAADVFDRLVLVARRVVPAAEAVGVFTGDVDAQWQLLAGTGAGLVRAGFPWRTAVVEDLARDERWPALAAAGRELGVRAFACACSPASGERPVLVTWQAPAAGSFAGVDLDDLAAVGALAAAAVEAGLQRERAENLAGALESNRRIGIAIGVVMVRELVTAEQAFGRLRAVSQRRHRKLRDVAEEVVATGELARE